MKEIEKMSLADLEVIKNECESQMEVRYGDDKSEWEDLKIYVMHEILRRCRKLKESLKMYYTGPQQIKK